MRLPFIFFLTTLTALAASRVQITPEPSQNLTHDDSTYKLPLNWTGPATGDDTPPPASLEDEIWNKARCRGAALLKAMTLDEEESSRMLQWPYTQGPWDGDLKEALRIWSYKDEDDDVDQHQCNFAAWHSMKRAFEELGINPYPAVDHFGEQGHNHCFYVEHENGPAVEENEDGTIPLLAKDQWYTVDGLWYRSTGAFSRIGINAIDGVVYFLHRLSPEKAAPQEWEVSTVTPNLLPKLRSTSDLAWGFWNRVAAPDKLQNIKMFMAININNRESEPVIIPRALKNSQRGTDEVLPWPGTDFIVGADGKEGEAAEALIGSPNGLGAAYFLLQHKKQLGGAKFIWKIKIFKSDNERVSAPNLIFFVDPNPPPVPLDPKTPPSSSGSLDRARVAEWVNSSVVKRSLDGRNVLREHVWRAKM